MSKFSVIAIAVLAVIGVIGCGGDDDSAGDGAASETITVTTSSLTKAEFLKEANAICRRGRAKSFRELVAFAQRGSSQPSQSGGERLAEATKATLIPSIEKQIDEIQKLGAPSGDAEQIEKFLNTLQEKIEVVAELPSIVSRFPIDRILRPAGNLARAYGLGYCGYGEGVVAG